MATDDPVDRMVEYRDLREHVRQLRENVLEMDDLIDEIQWVAAGGRGAVQPQRVELLRESIEQLAADMGPLLEEAADPYELKDQADDRTVCAHCGKDLNAPANSGHLSDREEWVCSSYCESQLAIDNGDVEPGENA